MLKEKINKQTVKRQLGWAYHQFKWIQDEEAALMEQKREGFVKSLITKGCWAFDKGKVCSGKTSDGCDICSQGKWSCLFINGKCTADCFFCPENRAMKRERPPQTHDGIIVGTPEEYVEYLRKFDFTGVGISGGETLLVFDKLLSYVNKIKEAFAGGMYIWIYTNGDLVDIDKLERLKAAGVNEIRFNIFARGYNLEPVRLACKYIDIVTVEIPAIPEDVEIVRQGMMELKKIGVKHLNLHQLHSSKYNYQNLIKRDYTFLHLPGAPVCESEIAALDLMNYSLENDIGLAINYCSHEYKLRYQVTSGRKRAASLIREEFEGETDAGYIRRLSIGDYQDNIKGIVKNLKEKNYPKTLWAVNIRQKELYFHHSLLKEIDVEPTGLTVTYFEPYMRMHTGSGNSAKCIRLGGDSVFFVDKELAGEQKSISSKGAEGFRQLFINETDKNKADDQFCRWYNAQHKDGSDKLRKELRLLMDLTAWEYIESGFLKMY